MRTTTYLSYTKERVESRVSLYLSHPSHLFFSSFAASSTSYKHRSRAHKEIDRKDTFLLALLFYPYRNFLNMAHGFDERIVNIGCRVNCVIRHHVPFTIILITCLRTDFSLRLVCDPADSVGLI